MSSNYQPVNREPYSEVHCCLFSWLETDLRLDQDDIQLGRLLEIGFLFSVHHRKFFRDTNLKCDVDEILNLHGNDPEKLLLIYYVGHGYVTSGRMMLANGLVTRYKL